MPHKQEARPSGVMRTPTAAIVVAPWQGSTSAGKRPPRHSSGFATLRELLAARDILVLARRTAGLSQEQLAVRLGRPRSTVARWELGEMEPSYAAVMAVIDACGFSAMIELGNADASYLGHVGDMLRLEPLERLRRLGGEHRVAQALRLARVDVDGVLFGDVAAALCGWPLMFPPTGPLELCAADQAQELTDVDVVKWPPGTRGLGDVRRDRERISFADGLGLWVASPVDLLRIENARGRGVQALAITAVLEHRRRWPDGQPPPRDYTEADAAAAIETWLTRA